MKARKSSMTMPLSSFHFGKAGESIAAVVLPRKTEIPSAPSCTRFPRKTTSKHITERKQRIRLRRLIERFIGRWYLCGRSLHADTRELGSPDDLLSGHAQVGKCHFPPGDCGANRALPQDSFYTREDNNSPALPVCFHAASLVIRMVRCLCFSPLLYIWLSSDIGIKF